MFSKTRRNKILLTTIMGETKKVINIKKRKLKLELSKEKPDRNITRRLEESINRHKKWDKQRKRRRKN